MGNPLKCPRYREGAITSEALVTGGGGGRIPPGASLPGGRLPAGTGSVLTGKTGAGGWRSPDDSTQGYPPCARRRDVRAARRQRRGRVMSWSRAGRAGAALSPLSPRPRCGPGRDMAPRGRPDAAAMPKRGARKRLKFRADDVCSERGEDRTGPGRAGGGEGSGARAGARS